MSGEEQKGGVAPYVAQAQDDGGLINPALFPKIEVWRLTNAAIGLRKMGGGVKDEVADIAAEWDKLPEFYKAPEGPEVYAMLDPAKAEANAFDEVFDNAAGFIDDFADELTDIKPKLAELKAEAEEFRASVKNGVEDIDDSYIKSEGLYVYTNPAGYYNEPRTMIVDWSEHQPSQVKNNKLLGKLSKILAEMSTAEVDCANSINGLLENPNAEPYVAITAAQLFEAEGLPWGTKWEYEPKGCVESAIYGLVDVVVETISGLGTLLLGYDPVTGEFFQGEAYAQAWGGLGDFVLSTLVTLSPITLVSAGMQIAGEENAFTEWVNERNKVTANAVTSLVNIDLYAENPLQAWEEDGIRAMFNSAGNIATFFIPGANVSKAFEVGSASGRAASLAGTLADLVGPGGSFLVQGLVDLLTIGDNAVAIADNVADMAGDALHIHPAAAIDDIITPVVVDGPDHGAVDGPSFDTSAIDVSGIDTLTVEAPYYREPGGPDSPRAGEHLEVNGRDVVIGVNGELFYAGGNGRVGYGDYPADYPPPEGAAPKEFTETAVQGPPEPYSPSPEFHTNPDGTLTPLGEYAQAVDEHLANRSATEALALEANYTVQDLRSRDFPRRLQEDTFYAAFSHDFELLDQLDAIQDALNREAGSRAPLSPSGERAGMSAALDRYEQTGQHVIVGNREGDLAPGNSAIDAAAIDPEDGGLTVTEAKGGQSGYSLDGRRDGNGNYVQQGSTAYLNDMFRVDERFVDRLRDHAGANPEWAAQWNAGEVAIRYEVVYTDAAGNVTVRELVIDQTQLRLPTLP